MAASVKLMIASLLMFTWLFLAQCQQDGNSAPDRSIPDTNRKGLNEVVSYATIVAENEIGGRKMAFHKVKEHGGGTGQAEGKWGSKMERKNSVGHYFSAEVDDVDNDVDDDAGFVAFSADYHPPRHHPPKNN